MGDFDYIIVGGGSSGATLAGRLAADPSLKVLLLEAGPSDKSLKIKVPLVVRLAGTNFKEGKNILDNSGLKIISAENLDDAAKKIVEAIK